MDYIVILMLVFVAIALFLAGQYLGWFDAPAKDLSKAVEQGLSVEISPKDACIALCLKTLMGGADLSDGPCLSNEIAPDWVCDVSHDPREAVDNKAENQCPKYGNGATHFVEVGTDCKFIREY